LHDCVQKIPILRQLKFILTRDALIKLYTTFIRPVSKHGCELCNGCNEEMHEKLEKMQYEADRLITDLPSYSNHDSLHFETE